MTRDPRWAHYAREMASIARVDEHWRNPERDPTAAEQMRIVLHDEREELWGEALEMLRVH